MSINYDTNIQKTREYIIHELLEDCEDIGKTKWYYRPFKCSNQIYRLDSIMTTG